MIKAQEHCASEPTTSYGRIPEMSIVLPMGRRNPVQEIARLHDGFFTAIAVQQRSQIRKTYWDLGYGTRSHCLALPYIVFIAVFYSQIIDLKSFYIYYSNNYVTSKSSVLSYPNLCNVFSDCSVCLGDGVSVRYSSSMQGQIRDVLGSFWETRFTDHLMSNFFTPGQKLHPDLASLDRWAAASRRHRGFILRVNWRTAYSLKAAMEKALGA